MAIYGRLKVGLTKTNMKKQIHLLAPLTRRAKSAPFMVAALVFIFGSASAGIVRATSSCSSITDCQQQIASDNNSLANLENEATSYQDAIHKLESQIASIEKQISLNKHRQADLQGKIVAAQAKLDYEKTILGETLKAMYVAGQMSTVEMLATSQDLSTFVDAATYSNAVQNKIQNTLAEITELQQELAKQKQQVDQLLTTENTQETQLANARYEQQSLLNYNQSQQNAYNTKVSQNQQKLQELIAAQLAANNLSAAYYFIRFPGTIKRDPINAGANGGYPYANWPFSMSTAPGCVDGDGPDQWGYCTRQCVSYAAWAVAYSGRGAPYFYGNAKDWVQAARNAGVPVYTYPEPGDVAISTAGAWGHAMYVEAVNGNQIEVSQYNQQLTGQFSIQWRTWN